MHQSLLFKAVDAVDIGAVFNEERHHRNISIPCGDHESSAAAVAFEVRVQAGLQPGITSAFRDDYRQSIATGLKAATDRSYHGGSTRGGYGRGLAADIVSVKGATRAQRWVSTEKLWKWIDERGKEFGIGRPYLNRDPPHVAPVDGQEYVSRRGGAKTQEADAKVKRVAVHSKAKQAKAVKTANAAKSTKAAKIAKSVKLARARM